MAKVQMSPQKSQPWRDTSNSLFYSLTLPLKGPLVLWELSTAAVTHRSNRGSLAGKEGLSEGRSPPSLPDSGSFSIAGSFPRPRSGQGQAKVSSALHRAARSLPGTVFLELEFIDKFLPFIRHLTFKWLQVHRKLQTEVHRE